MEEKRKLPSTFLSPPSGAIKLGSDTWREAFNTEDDTDRIESIEITTVEPTKEVIFENLSNSTLNIVDDLDEVRVLSVKAKTTLAKLQEFKNATTATKCQSAADCKSNQVNSKLKIPNGLNRF